MTSSTLGTALIAGASWAIGAVYAGWLPRVGGLDQGELVTIRSLHGGDEGTRFEDARQAISSQFGNSMPAPRYGIPASK